MVVADPGHPIFSGITLDGNSEFTISESPSNISPATDAGNGTILATDPTGGRAWVAYWDEGVEFYAGAGQTTGAPRLWFGGGITVNDPKGFENFTRDGEIAFINAVNFMTGGEEPEIELTAYSYDVENDRFSVT